LVGWHTTPHKRAKTFISLCKRTKGEIFQKSVFHKNRLLIHNHPQKGSTEYHSSMELSSGAIPQLQAGSI
jgi:hypothetical protein